MKRFWGRALAGAVLVGVPAVFVPACAHDDTTLFVYDVLAQPTVTPGQSCTFTSSVTQPFINGGLLDIDLSVSYEAEFLIGNQMIAQANPNAPKTETSFIQVQGAVVTIKDSTGSQVLAQYTDNSSVTVPPASGGTPGFAPVGITIVDANTVLKYGANGLRVLTFTQFFGVTLGGQSVQSNVYEFPVDMCEGCLIDYLNAPGYPLPNCVNSANVAAPMSEPCIPGQDLAISCLLCLDNTDCNPQVQPFPTPDAGADAGTSSASSSTSTGIDSGTTGQDASTDGSPGGPEAGPSDATADAPADAEAD
ncbi:MAG TPA: hypothetical protein VEK07_03650 [Polyangiaceae bacterium]|nr:hypothetical protein [Polyangiaceae bacterium]